MAQLNRYSFAGYYFNQPNVKVRQVTKGSPPLRGSNFIAPGRTGEIWTPKKHGGRMLTLEILVIDEPRGTARMIFDQIQQLAATRTQSALVNYLDSGPRTAQAEIVNWTAQDIDNVGLVFVGQLDFYLADPWFYGATVSGSVTPTTTGSVGTVVQNNMPASNRASFTLAISGVTSGQPVIVGVSAFSFAVSSIADNFATPMTWTRIDGHGTVQFQELWIGTGGVGTSGTITVTMGGSGACGGWAVSLAGSSTGAGLLAVDVHGNSTGTGLVTLSLTPTALGEVAIYTAGIYGGSLPVAPWVTAPLLDGFLGFAAADLDTYTCPPSGTALSATWTGAITTYPQFAAGALIKTSGGATATLAVTNPGTVTAEKVVIDLLGPIVNPTVANLTNSTSVTYKGTVAGSTHLIIDTGTYTVLNAGLNAVGGISHMGAAPFLTLNPGVNNLAVYGSGCSGATLLTVSFAPPWV
jgi:phage-related protein